MGATAFAAYLIYIVLVFGLRSFVQWRRTGSTGYKGFSGEPYSLEWMGGALFVVAFLLAPVAALADAAGVLAPVSLLDRQLVRVLATVLYGFGLSGTLAAQFWMGDSWRMGVDSSEQTTLVTSGPFEYVRNPIFTALLLTSTGLALMVPNALAAAALLAMFVAIEIQVRSVEEPYLLHAHGAVYASYTQRVGRFLPAIGMTRSAGTDSSKAAATHRADP